MHSEVGITKCENGYIVTSINKQWICQTLEQGIACLVFQLLGREGRPASISMLEYVTKGPDAKVEAVLSARW